MLAFAIILVFLLKNRETKVHLRISNYLPVLVLIINFFSLSCLNATMFWWVILFSILPIYCYSVNDNRGGSEKNEQTE